MNSLPAALILTALSSALLAEERPSPPRRDWDLRLGVMGITGPASVGADQSRQRILPMVHVEYRGRVFLGSTPALLGAGLGVHALKGPRLSWDVALGYTEGRKEHRADVLAGMGDQSGAAWLGTSLRYRLGPLTLGLMAAQGLSPETGARFRLNLEQRIPLNARWTLGTQAWLGASDRKGMAHEFGVDAAQAARRQALIAAGDPRLEAGEGGGFRPGGGLRDAGAGLMLSCRLGRGWSLMGTIQDTHLLGQAEDSPLVRRRNTVSAGLGINYHF